MLNGFAAVALLKYASFLVILVVLLPLVVPQKILNCASAPLGPSIKGLCFEENFDFWLKSTSFLTLSLSLLLLILSIITHAPAISSGTLATLQKCSLFQFFQKTKGPFYTSLLSVHCRLPTFNNSLSRCHSPELGVFLATAP